MLLLALAWSLRPRAPHLPDSGPVLLRADAPGLYALVDEIARTVGTRGVDRIVVDTQPNASVNSHGLRGRRQLTLGLPLWEILTPQQRIALLGHELAHYSNGDTRRALVVSRAYASLTAWHYYFAPTPDPTLIEMFVNLVFAVPRLLVLSLLTLLDHLTFRAAQRAEYLADRGAASAGSTAAAEELLDLLLVVESVDVVLRREANRAALTRGARCPRGRGRGRARLGEPPGPHGLDPRP
ncbi:M48 family metallopeptidase [Streptomyces sp. NPDC050534]|uniref:M48 family metallopeptidase n=1 Tax=Streptomyces sp. NPDC050534 TaxID=3365625 RepID=UPI0037ABE347